MDASYTPVTFVSTTLADFGGAATGRTREYYNPTYGTTQKYVLVLSAGTIPDGALCRMSTGQTTTGATTALSVVVTDAITVPCTCVNNTGASIATATYFWGLTGNSIGYGLGVGAVGDGLEIMPAAAGGGAVDAAAGATATVCGVAISDLAATVANKIHWNLPMGGPQA